jgi:WD40 repeat protein
VLTPDSLASTVCGEEVQRATELNKRIIPVLRRSVDGLEIPPPLSRPNWIYARPEDDFDTSVVELIEALELDEAWVEQHARLNQRTGEWLRHDRDGSYLLRGSDLRDAEAWLDDQAKHSEAPTANQITYITASRRAATRRLRGLLAGVAVALVLTAILAVAAFVQRERAIDREKTARAQAAAAQSIAELSRDPEESLRDALEAVGIRPDEPEAIYALRRAVSSAGWTSMFRPEESGGAARLLDVEFSEDGRRVATAGSDGGIAVWDVRTGDQVSAFTTDGEVHTVQFSPDGRQVLTASAGGLAETWDSSTGERSQEFDTGSDDAMAATWGAGGRRILTVSSRGGEVWDAASGDSIRQLPGAGGSAGVTRMSLDGQRALTAGKDGTARLWNIRTGTSVTLPGTSDARPLVFSLFSGDARHFATFYQGGAFCVWSQGGRNARFCQPTGESSDVDLSRNGRRVLRADRDGVVEVWDTASRTGSRKPMARLITGGTVSTAQFDRSGNYIVTGGDDGLARVWQVQPARRIALLRGHLLGVRRARFSPDGRLVATVSDDGSARLWSTTSNGPEDATWQRADSTVFSPNSRDVLVVRGRHRAVWNTNTGTIVPLEGGGIPMLDTSSWPCGRAAGCSPWSPDGRLVAGAQTNGRVVLWNPRTGRVQQSFGKASRTVNEVGFSPDGHQVVVADAGRPAVTIWNVATGKPKETRATREALSSAQFIPNPPRLLTVNVVLRAQLFDTATGTTMTLAESYAPAVARSMDGGQFAVGTTSGVLRVFSPTGILAARGRATDDPVKCVAFNRAGAAIATGGQRGAVTVWAVRPRTLTPTPLRAFGGEVTGVSFSPDGDLLLVTSGVTARLWDWRQQRVIVELPRTRDVRAEFSPDGSRIVIAGKSRLEVVRCDACRSLDALRERASSLLPAT